MTAGMNHQHSDWEQQFERLSAYLDDQLDTAERAALERHLPTCADCQQALAELRTTRAALRSLPVPALPRSFVLPETGAIPEPLATRQRVRTAAPASRRRASNGRLLQWAGGLVATIGLFFLIGSALMEIHPAGSGASSTAQFGAAATRTTPSQAPNVGLQHTQGPNTTTEQTPSPTQTLQAAPSPSPVTLSPQDGTTGSTAPIGELTGTVLLIGGAGLVVSGTVLSRRRRRT